MDARFSSELLFIGDTGVLKVTHVRQVRAFSFSTRILGRQTLNCAATHASSFAAFYRNRLWRNEVAIKRKERSSNIEEIKVDGAAAVELNGLEQRNS